MPNTIKNTIERFTNNCKCFITCCDKQKYYSISIIVLIILILLVLFKNI